MAGNDDDIHARSELESRVYSRSGSDEPRIERYDHASGRVLELTESEWRLLEIERAHVSDAGLRAPAPGGELERGMTMNAVIPRGVGTRIDQDGDGVMGRASETEVLTVDWRLDGTFVVTRHDP